MDRQPTLRGDLVTLRPLKDDDKDALFSVAADPRIWEQHPARPRSDPTAFEVYFREALSSGGALVIVDNLTGATIGASRFHGYREDLNEVEIGWTFLARAYWGGDYNGEVKALMLGHAFQFVDHVVLLISETNKRSCRAAEKIGAVHAGSRRDGGGRVSRVYRIHAPGSRSAPSSSS